MNLLLKSCLYLPRGITSKRVKSGGSISAGLALGLHTCTAPEKRRNSGEPLATLCPIRSAVAVIEPRTSSSGANRPGGSLKSLRYSESVFRDGKFGVLKFPVSQKIFLH